MKQWILETKGISARAEAKTAAEAFDTLIAYHPKDFGLIVTAQPEGEPEDNRVAIRTSMLFGRWGEEEIARQFIAAAIKAGLPDTSETDL